MVRDQAQEGGTGSAEVRVSNIELFFDLVFVFAITQLTSPLAGDPTMAGLGRVVLIFGNLWWMYGGYAWLTNAVPPRVPMLRLLMLLGMGGFLSLPWRFPPPSMAAASSWLALYGFGYAFLPVLGGIIVFAAGVKNAIVHYDEPATASTAWLLAVGVATYLVGLAWFRQLLGIGPIGARLAIAGAVLPTAMIGLAFSPEAQLGVLAAVVVGGVLAEPAWERRTRAAPGG